MKDNRKSASKPLGPLPAWLRKPIREHREVHRLKTLLRRHELHTVCESARCPNIGECFGKSTATFLILGDRCTRDCAFCAIESGVGGPPDPAEPQRIAEVAAALMLRYIVVTSVTRDDLQDGGAGQFAQTILALKERTPAAQVEVLAPDFYGRLASIDAVIAAGPVVFNHNLETVPRLYAEVRPQAIYERSLDVLEMAHDLAANYPQPILIKSGLMVGLGEAKDEVIEVMRRLLAVGCDILTIGQYLQPRRTNRPVKRYVHPDEFAWYRAQGLGLGFKEVFSGPLVRSSFSAAEVADLAAGR